MRKKVLVISEYELQSFNGAAFERLKCYAKAQSDKDFICFYALAATHNTVPESLPEVSNLYFVRSEKRPEGFLYRNFFKHFDFISPLGIYNYLKNTFKKEEVTILLYSSWLPLFTYVILGLGSKHKYKVVIEKNEIETGIVKNISAPSGLAFIFFAALYPYRIFAAWIVDRLTCRGSVVISISTNIHNRYRSYTTSVCVPVLVDPERFEIQRPVNGTRKKVIYLGAISEKKDGLFELVEILKNNPIKNLSFDIIGSGNSRVTEKLSAAISAAGLDQDIRICPPVTGNEVPDVLKNYNYSLLLRPLNTQTKFGFSTKLGEYLAAGLPVIYTDVSDNTLFLKNGVHGFLIPFPLLKNAASSLMEAANASAEILQTMRVETIKLVKEKFDYRLYKETLNNIFN